MDENNDSSAIFVTIHSFLLLKNRFPADAATGIINQTQVDVYADGDWQFPAANEKIMVLHTLIISVKSGHRGSGRGFLDFYENHAKEMGCPYLRLDTNARNTAARAFYGNMVMMRLGSFRRCSMVFPE